jgi:hypothetical protein
MAGIFKLFIDSFNHSMKYALLSFLLWFFSLQCIAQTTAPKRKSLYFEFGGSGGLGSMNLEKNIRTKGIHTLTWSAGFSIAPIDKNNGFGLVFPIMLHSLTGKKAHQLELGIGQGITVTTKGSFFALTTAAIGYRYQAENKKWFYRVTYTPLISYLIDFQVQQWAGFSIGYQLKTK